MSDPIGRYEQIKSRFISMIDSAISGDPHFGHVSEEWSDIPRNLAQNLPLVTVRFGPITRGDEVYGKVLSSDNSTTDYGYEENWSFTLYCFASACKESGEGTDRYVHKLVDDIKDYLEQHRFEQKNYGINDIGEFSDRESNEGLPRGVRRMIVEGTIWVKKTQDLYYEDALPFRLG